MVKTRVNVTFDAVNYAKELLDEKTVNLIGSFVVSESKTMIAKGQSPVEGHGAFKAYKNPSKYPGNRKPSRPVNLKLEGSMLDSLTFRRVSPTKMSVGMYGASSEDQAKAKAHNEGTADMPMRRFIPQEGEQYVKRITSRVMEILDHRLGELIRQSGKTK